MTAPRTIAAVTGSRSDFSHLAPVLHAVAAHPLLTLKLAVTGQHLDPNFGSTWMEIERAGFSIDAKLPLPRDTDSPVGTAEAAGAALHACAQYFSAAKPDAVLVLGDRFEIFAAAAAASILTIPIAHIHGGEVTNGAFDDALRHSITKMAALHFCASSDYANRVRQMGEAPAAVFDVGAPVLDRLNGTADISPTDVLARFGLSPDRPLCVVLYHPETRAEDFGAAGAKALTAALSELDVTVLMTGVNADPGHAAIAKVFERFAAADTVNRVFHPSLPCGDFLAVLASARCLIGNSSAGLIEAPALGVPSINIGRRQDGRSRAPSVHDVPPDANAIRHALLECLANPTAVKPENVQTSGASRRIADILARTDFKALRRKTFHDIL